MMKLNIISILIAVLLGACGQANENGKTPEQKNEEMASGEKISINLPQKGEIEVTQVKPKRAKIGTLKDHSANPRAILPEKSAALPDFREVPAGKERKELFVQFLAPIIEAENASIREKRHLIKQLYRGIENGETLSAGDEKWLNELAHKYRINNRDFPSEVAFKDLLMHVDIIPVRLAIVQSANETAWGTSKFALHGNNFYGKWCFTEGCGIVPARRKAGATHEVEVYPTVAHSVESYMHHVNSHPGYHELREKRYEQRLNDQVPEGHEIATGLRNYSAIGMDYVRILRNMMDNLNIEA